MLHTLTATLLSLALDHMEPSLNFGAFYVVATVIKPRFICINLLVVDAMRVNFIGLNFNFSCFSCSNGIDCVDLVLEVNLKLSQRGPLLIRNLL